MEEKIVWSIRPSLWIYAGRISVVAIILIAYWSYGRELGFGNFTGIVDAALYGLCGFVLAILFLEYITTSYVLEPTRLIVRKGILAQYRNEVELYRIKDYTLVKPLLLRIVGVSNLQLHTSDYTSPNLKLQGLYSGDFKLNEIRKMVEKMREEKGVFEVD